MVYVLIFKKEGTMNFYDKVHELVRSLKDTEEYKNYMELKTKIKGDSVLNEKITNFRNRQMEYQKQYLNGIDMDDNAKQEMQQLYSLIIQSPLGAAYFQAEVRLDVLLADMQKIINDGVKDALDL